MTEQIHSKDALQKRELTESGQLEAALSRLSLDLMKETRSVEGAGQAVHLASELSLPAFEKNSVLSIPAGDKNRKLENTDRVNPIAEMKPASRVTKPISTAYDRFDHSDGKLIPHNPEAVLEEKEFAWRGAKLQLRILDGVPDYFRDENGNEWKSQDGNGWTKKDGRLSETFQSKIKFDEAKLELSLENPFGNRTVYRSDGSVSTSFSTREGRELSFTRTSDGRQIVNDGESLWESADGKNWSSKSEQKQGKFELDDNGRLLLTDSRGQEKLVAQSEQAQALNDKMVDLEKRYNIKLGRPGERPLYSGDDKNIPFDLRLPTKEELQVVEDVLNKFAHVARKNGSDFQGLNINFAASRGNALAFEEHGWHDESKGGRPQSIGIAPRDFVKTRGFDGMEGTLLHEFAHQLQELEWIDADRNERVPPDIERYFGFEKVEPPLTRDEDGTYRLTDSNGKKWQYDSESGDLEGADAKWYPVENGKIVMDNSRAIDEREMRQKMQPSRRPPTDYFFNPAETHAETISMFLYDRRLLHDINPSLYQATKKWDQRDINYRYGFQTRADGQIVPRMIRSADGKLVPNTSENRRSVQVLEESWARSPEKTHDFLQSIRGHRCPRC